MRQRASKKAFEIHRKLPAKQAKRVFDGIQRVKQARPGDRKNRLNIFLR